MTSNFNLRGIPSEVMTLLKREAEKLHVSVNTLILKTIEQRIGFSHKKQVYNDLDYLANTWSSTEEKAFKKNTRPFEQIDKDLWL